jgi:hypothetical protein
MPIWSVASSRKTEFGPANEQLQSWGATSCVPKHVVTLSG